MADSVSQTNWSSSITCACAHDTRRSPPRARRAHTAIEGSHHDVDLGQIRLEAALNERLGDESRGPAAHGRASACTPRAPVRAAMSTRPHGAVPHRGDMPPSSTRCAGVHAREAGQATTGARAPPAGPAGTHRRKAVLYEQARGQNIKHAIALHSSRYYSGVALVLHALAARGALRGDTRHSGHESHALLRLADNVKSFSLDQLIRAMTSPAKHRKVDGAGAPASAPDAVLLNALACNQAGGRCSGRRTAWS
jgi:hypothetical protein